MSKDNNSEEKRQHNPLHAEAQLYRRIEMARTQIATAVNKTMRDTGLPTAIMLELLRGIVAETSLMLERAAGAAVRETIEAAAAEAEAAAAKAGGAEKEKASGDK